MKSKGIKKILAGVQTAALVTGIAMMTTGCHKEGKSSCSSCSDKTKIEKPSDPCGSCGKGSCSK
jgi:radical SAM modification target selenobiotic family peptide